MLKFLKEISIFTAIAVLVLISYYIIIMFSFFIAILMFISAIGGILG